MASSPCASSGAPAHFRVEFATPKDAADMLAVYAPYISTPATFEDRVPTTEEYAARVNAVLTTYPALVLKHDNDICGFVYAHAQSERRGYRFNAELSVYLTPDATGCGRGRVLYRTLLELLRLQGMRCAYARVVLDNPASERLHAACGFERAWVQQHAGWKCGAWRNVAWYVRALGPFDDNPAEPVPFPHLLKERGNEVAGIIMQANTLLANGTR